MVATEVVVEATTTRTTTTDNLTTTKIGIQKPLERTSLTHSSLTRTEEEQGEEGETTVEEATTTEVEVTITTAEEATTEADMEAITNTTVKKKRMTQATRTLDSMTRRSQPRTRGTRTDSLALKNWIRHTELSKSRRKSLSQMMKNRKPKPFQ